MNKSTALLLPASIVLIFAAVAEGVANPVPAGQVARFVVPKLASAPKIDGHIGADEWRRATVVSGVADQANNILNPRPTMFYLGWDDDHLYLACRVYVMKDYKPRAPGRTPRSACHLDDGPELILTPRGRNVPKGRPGTSYKFNVNALGITGTLTRVALGQLMQDWLPKFDVATSLSEPGTAPDGGRWLEIELSGTTGDFELAGENRPGDAWGIMLGFDGLGGGFQRVPCNTGYFDAAGHTVGMLADDVPGVKVIVDRPTGVADGVVNLRLEAFNPADKPVELSLHVGADEYPPPAKGAEPNAIEILALDRTLSVEPGKSGQLAIDQKLPRLPAEKNLGSLSYQVKQGDRVLLQWFSYFKPGQGAATLKVPPPKDAFPLAIEFDPVGSRLAVTTDSYYLSDPAAARGVRYRVFADGAAAGKKPLAEGTIDHAVDYYFRDLVQLPALAPGDYRLEATLALADGSTLGPVTQGFAKLDEAKAFADWWGNDIGNVERVIAPFEGVQRDGDSVEVWGRRYRLAAGGLPASIVSQGEEILAAPVHLVAVVAGREYTLVPDGATAFTDSGQWRVGFRGRGRLADLTVAAEGWIEQDGLCFYRLTFTPPDGGVKIDSLRIETPLTDRQSEVLACVGPGSNFSARTTRVIAGDRREGEIWNTLQTGLSGSRMTVGSFYPCVWVGSEQRGLLWWGDSDQGWSPRNESPAHSLRRQGKAVVLINHIISVPEQLAGPRTVEFGLMASPFRPLIKNWRYALQSRDGTFTSNGFKVRTDPNTGKQTSAWWCISPPSPRPADWPALWAEFKQKSDERAAERLPFDPIQARNREYVHNSVPLIGYSQSLDNTAFNYFRFSWGQGRWQVFNRTHQDYLLYLLRQSFVAGGLRTMYWDLLFPTAVEAPHVGVGYVLPDGRVQPGYFGFNLRRFMMRLYALNHDAGVWPGGNTAHATNAPFLVASPWVDAILDGEYHHVQDDSDFDWVDGWTIERMRALSVSENFGYAMSWMDVMHVTGPRAEELRRTQFDYVRLFDSWSTHNYRTLTDQLLRWGILDAQYVPFWRNPYAASREPNILVGAWRLKDRVLLEVYNLDRAKTATATVKVDLDALGLVPQNRWQDFLRVEPLDVGPGSGYAGVFSRGLADEDDSWKKPPTLDYPKRVLTVENIRPRRARWISIRLY